MPYQDTEQMRTTGSGVELRPRGQEEPLTLTSVAVEAPDWERARNTTSAGACPTPQTWEAYVDWPEKPTDAEPPRPPITCWWCETVNHVEQHAVGIIRCMQCDRNIS